MSEIDLASIRLHMSIAWGGEVGAAETMEHEVRFSTVGVPKTLVIATVRGDPIKPPRVLRYARRGELALKQSLLDQIVLACFSRLGEQLVLQNTGERIAELQVDGNSILRHFPSADAALVSAALSNAMRGHPAGEK